MILAIDIGNTNIVIGCCADGQVIFRERVSTNPTATVLEYAAMLKMAFDMNRADITAVDGAILSSVVPAVTLTMRDAVHKYLHLTPLVVGPGMKTGLNIALDNPATMGSDLVVGAAAQPLASPRRASRWKRAGPSIRGARSTTWARTAKRRFCARLGRRSGRRASARRILATRRSRRLRGWTSGRMRSISAACARI